MCPESIRPDPNSTLERDVPETVIALDVPDAREAHRLLDRLPDADFVKVGLQLFTAEGPSFVRTLRGAGKRVFLDLKLHDIPNTVARAVEAAAELDVELLTIHASGGPAMLESATRAAGERGPRLLAVTVLTSLDAGELARSWGRGEVHTQVEVLRLARLARESGVPGVVASVREARALRDALGTELRILTPGIRLAGDDAGDQARIATPAQAAAAGSDYLVLGRTVTGAPDPADALRRVREEIRSAYALREAQ